MSLNVLAQGKLLKQPERRTSASGKLFATAQIAVATEATSEADTGSALLSLICFRREAVAALLALDAGDSVAVTGRAKLGTWSDKTTGETKVGLSVAVEQVLTVYHVRRKREAISGAQEQPVGDDRAQAGTAPERERAPASRYMPRRPLADPATVGDAADLADDLPWQT